MLFEDIRIAGVKVGLLGNQANLKVVAACLEAHKDLPVVIDPVCRSTSGTEFLSPHVLEAFKRLLFPLALALTPNAEEAGRLLGAPVSTLDDMKGAAKLLHEQGVRHVVVTGGHLEKPTDVYYGGQELEVFTGHRVDSQSTHGTGCTFSSAILANLIHGKALVESVVLAKAYVTQAISRAYPVGNGHGPLNHLFRFGDAPVRASGLEVVECLTGCAENAAVVVEAIHYPGTRLLFSFLTTPIPSHSRRLNSGGYPRATPA
jgi:hydroxymethylpyrimidine/phosphomethylpyrimidine kinase